MTVHPTSNIRNVVIAGHSDSGKTTLVSQLLHNSGMVTRLGTIDDGTTVTDFDDDEISRKHSISAAVAFAEWKGKKINIIDTPGYGVFMMESKGAIRAADAAAIVVSAVTGVEVNTEKAWKFAEEFEIPALFIASKLDRDRASISRVVDSLQNKFGKAVVPIQLPLGEEKDFTGVVDLLSMKAYVYKDDASGDHDVTEIPEDLKATAEEWREQLIEKVAEGDDSLMERFFDEGGLSQEELLEGLKRELAEREIHPLLFASPSHNIGGHLVLDAFASLLPAPDFREEILGKNEKGEPATVPPSTDGPPLALIFKTISDPFAGRLSIFRVYSGTIRSDTTYYNSTREHDERVGKLQLLLGKQQTPVGELHAGDIGAVAKLKDSHTGDTLSEKSSAVRLDHIKIP